MVKGIYEVAAVNIIPDLFAFIAEYPVFAPDYGAFHKVCKESMELGACMRRTCKAAASKHPCFHTKIPAVFLD